MINNFPMRHGCDAHTQRKLDEWYYAEYNDIQQQWPHRSVGHLLPPYSPTESDELKTRRSHTTRYLSAMAILDSCYRYKQQGYTEADFEDSSDSDDDDSDQSEVPFGVDVTAKDILDELVSMSSPETEPQVSVHIPFASENHFSQVQPGEILIGGMPRHERPRPKGKQRKQRRKKSETKEKKAIRMITEGLPKTLSNRSIFPQWQQISFNWIITGLISAAAAYGQFVYRVNGTIPDAANTSLPCAEKDEADYVWSLYRLYRFKLKYTFINLEAFPVQIVVVPMNTSITFSSITAESAAGLPGARLMLVSPKGGIDKITGTVSQFMADIAGTTGVYYDDDFENTYAIDCADGIYVKVFVSSMGAGNISNGVRFTSELTQDGITYAKRADTYIGKAKPDPPASSARSDEIADLAETLASATARLASLTT